VIEGKTDSERSPSLAMAKGTPSSVLCPSPLPTPTEYSGARPTTKAGIENRYINALDIDLQHACKSLLRDLPPRTADAQVVKTIKSFAQEQGGEPAQSIERLCSALRALLLIPSCTQHVAVHFHPLLIYLLAGFLPGEPGAEDTPDWSSQRTQDMLVMFGILLPPFEHIFP
jgi:hypothetical protein